MELKIVGRAKALWDGLDHPEPLHSALPYVWRELQTLMSDWKTVPGPPGWRFVHELVVPSGTTIRIVMSVSIRWADCVEVHLVEVV